MEKRADSPLCRNAPTRVTASQFFKYPETSVDPAAGAISASVTPTHAPLPGWREPQLTVSVPEGGKDIRTLRASAYPLSLRPIAPESALVAHQRRAQYPDPTRQHLRRNFSGCQFSLSGSPCTPTTSGSPYALSCSPMLSSILSGRSGCADSDKFKAAWVNGRAVHSGELRTGHPNIGVVCRTPVSGGTSAAGAGDAVSGGGRSIPIPRKFSPNIDASRSTVSSVKHDAGHSSAINVKKEAVFSKHSVFGTEEGLLSRMLLQSARNSSKKPGDSTTSVKGYNVGLSSENVRRLHGHTGSAGSNGPELPASMRTSARIMESNIRLLQEQLRSSKEGRKIKERKSKDLLELSWTGGSGKDRNSMAGMYTPLTLPFVVKEEAEEEEDEHKEDRTPEETDRTQKRSRKTRRPTARHVEEANRFAAGVLLVEEQHSRSARSANSDTWDLADDEGSEGIEFLHICFPFAFPPLDRQAMMEAEELRLRELTRSDSSSTADSTDGREHSGPGTRSDPTLNRKGKSKLPSSPLQPSPPLRLPDLPAGRIGRLLVHRSGRVKLRLLSSSHEGNEGVAEASSQGNPTHTQAPIATTDGAATSENASAKNSPGVDSSHVGYKARKTSASRGGGAENGVSFEVNVGSECTFAQVRIEFGRGVLLLRVYRTHEPGGLANVTSGADYLAQGEFSLAFYPYTQ